MTIGDSLQLRYRRYWRSIDDCLQFRYSDGAFSNYGQSLFDVNTVFFIMLLAWKGLFRLVTS